jgi:hypothetical protein
MSTNLYLVEQNASERHQHIIDQAARDYAAAQMPDSSTTRSKSMKRITRRILAAVVALTILGAGSQAVVAQHEPEQQVASMCCIRRP